MGEGKRDIVVGSVLTSQAADLHLMPGLWALLRLITEHRFNSDPWVLLGLIPPLKNENICIREMQILYNFTYIGISKKKPQGNRNKIYFCLSGTRDKWSQKESINVIKRYNSPIERWINWINSRDVILNMVVIAPNTVCVFERCWNTNF